jgi:hypothetical protein
MAVRLLGYLHLFLIFAQLALAPKEASACASRPSFLLPSSPKQLSKDESRKWSLNNSLRVTTNYLNIQFICLSKGIDHIREAMRDVFRRSVHQANVAMR